MMCNDNELFDGIKLSERDDEDMKELRNKLCIMSTEQKFRNYFSKNRIPEYDVDDLIQNVRVSVLEESIKCDLREDEDMEAYLYRKCSIQKKRYWDRKKKEKQRREVTRYDDETDEPIDTEIPDIETGYDELIARDAVSDSIKVIKRYRNVYGVDIVNLVYIVCKLKDKEDTNQQGELRKVCSCLGYDLEKLYKGTAQNRGLREAIENLTHCDSTMSEISDSVLGKDTIDRFLA